MANRILALWSAPRSVSTAFERMMMARGDHEVIHEPFSAHYYLSDQRSSARFPDAPDPRHRHDEILETITARARHRPVFVKDMAYHIRGVADRLFAARFVNTFIIRDPAEALPSLFHMWPDFTGEEAGYEAVRHLFELACGLGKQPPAVINAADLLRAPESTVRAYCDAVDIPFLPEAMAWQATSPPEWKMWDAWHADAKASTSFRAPAKKRYRSVTDEPRLAEAHAACLPHYRRLRAARIRVP